MSKAAVLKVIKLPLLFFLFLAGSKISNTNCIAEELAYAGSDKCSECHPSEAKLWEGSHHQLAMQKASDKTVRGNFSNQTFSYAGTTSKFYRKGSEFWVKTDGPNGKLTDYRIEFTFGVYPLQQYLIRFPAGKLQALSICWDARPASEGGQRWFHLYPNEKVNHKDILHWTRVSHNWNFMCADCHSTNVRKGYSPEKKSYNTTFSEISVGCEACHGPGSKHMSWAKTPVAERSRDSGLANLLKDSTDGNWQINSKTSQPYRTAARHSTSLTTCAPCHSRRSQIQDHPLPGATLTSSYMPSVLSAGLYHADGQIQDEVYEYGSFLQSKMHAAGVTCTDCHDPHSQKLKADGNDLCAGCHLPTKYDVKEHHFHKSESDGALCVSCHMPTTNYMVIHQRRDHSIRIPRPDLSQQLNTSNACNKCHGEHDSAWAAAQIVRWYGPKRKGFQNFGEALLAARNRNPSAEELLLKLLRASETPSIVKATALSELAEFLSTKSLGEVQKNLNDPDALVRLGALQALANAPSSVSVPLSFKMLSDPERAVRLRATTLLNAYSGQGLPPAEFAKFTKASEELRREQTFASDTPQGLLNLAITHSQRGESEQAKQLYFQAIELEENFIAAYINLSDLYRAQNNEVEAEKVLRQALLVQPKSAEAHYALGLLLIRGQKKSEALPHLKRASELSNYPNFILVYAIGLRDMGEKHQASQILEQGAEKYSQDPDMIFALATWASEDGDRIKAKRWAEKYNQLWPNDPRSSQLQALVSKD